MNSFLVCLDVISEALSLEDLSSLLGHQPSADSHDKGTARAWGSPWSHTIWRLNSQAPEEAALEEHCESVLAQASAVNFDRIPPEVRVDLNIAVFFHTANCSVSLPAHYVAALAKLGVGLEITCYPTKLDP